MVKGLLIALAFLCRASLLFADTDAEVNARKNALDIAGAFTNEGFKLRDGHWCGTLKPQDQAAYLDIVNNWRYSGFWLGGGSFAQLDPATSFTKSRALSVTGNFSDSQRLHGFLRTTDGTITSFDVPATARVCVPVIPPSVRLLTVAFTSKVTV